MRRVQVEKSSVGLLLPLPACGERVGVRGTFHRFVVADSPPHPDRKSDPTSPRKRGEVMRDALYFVSGQPLSLAVKKALSPGTTASCL